MNFAFANANATCKIRKGPDTPLFVLSKIADLIRSPHEPASICGLIPALVGFRRIGWLDRLACSSACVLVLAGCSRPASPAGTGAIPPPQPAAAAIAAPARHAAGFKFASQTLTVPEGFTIELVAGPPLVNRPISLAFDELGRLYATDSSGFSGKAEQQWEQKPHRVVRLEDADGDGRFEKSVVFAEHMMFPQGALFHEGSLYVATPPQIAELTDTDGDGVADRRGVWYDGKTFSACGNEGHGPYLGADGRIYWTKGGYSEQHHTLPDGRPFVSTASHIFRARPDGSEREPVLTGGMANPVGLTFTSTGDRFLSGTFFVRPGAGQRDGLIHSIYGGVYGQDTPKLDGHPRTGDLMPIMTHMGAAAPCGSTAYRSRVFGRDFADNLFVCYFNLRKISRHELLAGGATFRTKDTDFVTSDSQDFHPTDVLEDADGSLLVADTGGWYRICCPTSQLVKPDVLGGIYRIRKIGAPKIDDPRGLKLAWAKLPFAELAKLLADDRCDVQQRAIDTLGRQGAAAVPILHEVAMRAASGTARKNAIWALARIDGAAARTAVRAALRNSDSSVAYVALQVVSLSRDRDAIEQLTGFLSGDQPALARMAAEALGRIGDPRAIDPLFGAIGRLGDTKVTAVGSPEDAAERVLEHSFIYACIEIGRRDEVRAHLKSSAHPRVVRAAMVALDQMAGGGLEAGDVIGRLESAVPAVKQTAAWIAGHHPEWGGVLASHFRERLAANARSAAERDELQTLLAQLAESVPIQDLLAATAGEAGDPVEARLLALRAMAASGLKKTPEPWFSALVVLLSARETAILRQAVATARAVALPKTGHGGLSAALAGVGRDAGAPADVRAEALAAAPGGLSSVEPELFDFLCAQLATSRPMPIRHAAATALAKAPLAPQQRLLLADTMKTVGPFEAPKLLPAFEKGPDETLGLKLVAALKESTGRSGLRVEALKPLFAKYPPSVQQRGQELLAQLNADAARQNAHVDELLASLKPGDVRRGQAVFNSAKGACLLCHSIGYLGGRLGPDLTKIAAIRSERELLEAIVFPSATFVRGYEPVVVTTKNGEAHSGILLKDAADEVVLAIGPETERHLARAEIADMQPGATSPMPPGMDAVLTREELGDLLTFLKSGQLTGNTR